MRAVGMFLELAAHSNCTSGCSPFPPAQTPLSLLRTCSNLGLCQCSSRVLVQSPQRAASSCEIQCCQKNSLSLPPTTLSQPLMHCPDWWQVPGLWESSVLPDSIGPINPAEGKVLSETSVLQNVRISIQTISSEGKSVDPKLALN